MSSPMDNFQYNQAQMPNDIMSLISKVKNNPIAFEEEIKKSNPDLYNTALKLKNSNSNPKALVMEIMRQRGIDTSILSLFGL